jgi:hypothetical protein
MAGKESDDLAKRRKNLLRHIDNVRDLTVVLGDRLIESGEIRLGHRLIANGYCHDASKFYGAEWEYLNDETKEKFPDLFQAAQLHHVSINKHHPEAWEGGIHAMDRLHRAEMICDWAARSSEFGKDLREWIKKVACKKYNMTVQSTAYKDVKELVDMLLDKAFS